MVRGFMNINSRRPLSHIYLDGFDTLIRYHGTKHINLGSIVPLNQDRSVFGHLAIDGLSLEFDKNGDKIPFYQFDLRYHVFPFSCSSNLYRRRASLRGLIDDVMGWIVSPIGMLELDASGLCGISDNPIAFRYLKLMVQTQKRLKEYHKKMSLIHDGLYTCRGVDAFFCDRTDHLNILQRDLTYHFFTPDEMNIYNEERIRWAGCQSSTSTSNQCISSSTSTSNVPF